MSAEAEDWTCPKPGCDLDVDGHDFGLAIAHCLDMDEQEADAAADRILTRAERALLGPTQAEINAGWDLAAALELDDEEPAP